MVKLAILDSSVIIHLLKGTEKGKLIRDNFNEEITATTSLCVHETLFGTKQREREATLSFIEELEVMPYDKNAALKSVEIEESLYKKGRPINKLDILIASACLIHNLSLLTTDEGYTHIENLKVIKV